MILSKKISPYSEDTYKDLFNLLFKTLLEWYKINPEILHTNDLKDFKIYFFYFLLNINNTIPEYDEFLCLNYSESIVDLFLKMKNISSSYCSNILHEKFRTSDDLFNFIFTYSYLDEKNINDNETEIVEDTYFDYEY